MRARLQSISQFLGNKTVAATRLYWSRHRERLGLDGIMAERAAAGLGAEEPSPNAGPAAAAVAAIAGLPNLQAWAPLLDQLQRQQQEQQEQQEQQHQAALALVVSTPVPGVTSPGATAAQSAAQTPAATPAPVRPTALEAALAPSPGGVIAAAAIAAVLRAEQEDAAAAAADNMEVDAAAPPALGGAAPGQQQGQLQGQGSGSEVLNAAVGSAAASLLPRDELDKLQTLLEPGVRCAHTFGEFRPCRLELSCLQSLAGCFSAGLLPALLPISHPPSCPKFAEVHPANACPGVALPCRRPAV
jgi:hypothetical protein